jgi:hypothetical protein
MFLANALLVPWLSRQLDGSDGLKEVVEPSSKPLAACAVGAVFVYTIGAALKARPLGARLAKKEPVRARLRRSVAADRPGAADLPGHAPAPGCAALATLARAGGGRADPVVRDLFYAPVRMLFLVEDGDRPSTWLCILAVSAPFLRNMILG